MLIHHHREKRVQSILYFAHHAHSLGQDKLFSLLYLLDVLHFSQTGRSVTGMHYRALKTGPAPAQAALRAICGDLAGMVRMESPTRMVPLQAFDPEHFSRREMRHLAEVARRHRNALLVDIASADHGAWATTWNEGRGKGSTIPYALSLAADAKDRDAILEFAAEYEAVMAAASMMAASSQHARPS